MFMVTIFNKDRKVIIKCLCDIIFINIKGGYRLSVIERTQALETDDRHSKPSFAYYPVQGYMASTYPL